MSTPAERLVPDGTQPATDPAEALAAQLRTQYAARITGELVVPARDGQYASLPDGLDARLATALAERGVNLVRLGP